MHSRFTYLSLALAAVSLLEASPVFANPEVRDHRSGGFRPSVQTSPRYRRRPGPKFMLPLKIDIGAAGQNTSRGFAPGMAAAVGVHWASLSPEPTDFDVGIGVFGALLAAPEMTSSNDSNGVAMGGAYLEAGHTLSRGEIWRTWATGRGEYFGSSAFGENDVGFGATGRLSAELYLSGVGIEPRGLFLGTYAIGVYVEAGLRDAVTGVGKFHAGAGLTFRTPLVFSP